MKKISCFIGSLTSGGAEHQMVILANFLSEKGYEVELVTYTDILDHYVVSNKVKRIRIAENKSIIKKILRVFNYVLNTKVDCIISFMSRNNMLVLLPALFRKDIRIIAGERCVMFSAMRWYQRLNYSLLYNRADFLVPNSYTQKNQILNINEKYKEKTVVITNYTDYTLFDVRIPNNKIVKIGILARYAPQKNYVRFVEVVKILKEKSSVPFQFVWYGNKEIGQDVPNKYYLHFSELIKENGLEDVVVLNNHVQNVRDIIPQFDAMCLPSVGEGFSNAISEYICCGKPVLCSNVADNGFMVKNYINGFLFDPTDTDNMVIAIQDFLNLTEKEREEMCYESRKIAENIFDKNKFIESYIALIER